MMSLIPSFSVSNTTRPYTTNTQLMDALISIHGSQSTILAGLNLLILLVLIIFIDIMIKKI